MGDVKKMVDDKIARKKVMVFSKSTCPYSKMAKDTLVKHFDKDLSPNDYDVCEIDKESNCEKIQDVLEKITGARSVPRVFINKKFVGGGTEISEMESNGQLALLLK